MRTVTAQAGVAALGQLSPTRLSAQDGLGHDLGYDPGFTAEDVLDVKNRLHELADRCQLPSRNKARGGPFDQEACVIVHSGLKASQQAVADDGLWRYLCLAPLAEIVVRRYPWSEGEGGQPKPNPSNYGLGNRFDDLVLQLWMRGEIGKDQGYRYAKMGDVDLWRSHLLRVDMGSVRPLARALLVETTQGGPGERVTTEEVRKLVKNLRACQAFVCAELMTDEDARRFVREEIARLRS